MNKQVKFCCSLCSAEQKFCIKTAKLAKIQISHFKYHSFKSWPNTFYTHFFNFLMQKTIEALQILQMKSILNWKKKI